MGPDDNKPLVPVFRMRERGRPRTLLFYAIGGAVLFALVWGVTHLPSGLQQILFDVLDAIS
jgi:hypothetical protein